MNNHGEARITTRMTELCGIEHPIMLSGMNRVTTPALVAAVSNAGGLGVLAGTRYDADDLRRSIVEIRQLTDKPFGVNVLLGAGSRPRVEAVIDEQVPVVNYALGRPDDIRKLIDGVHAYGGTVMGSVAILKHAIRAESLGADMLNVTGSEAASHAGNVGALVLIPTVTESVGIPCIGSGGYADGRGLAAALALGADGIAMGCRLAATKEAEIPPAVKDAWVKASEEDTIIDRAFDGINCRVLRNRAAEGLMKKNSFPPFDCIRAAVHMKQALGLSGVALVKAIGRLRTQSPGLGGGTGGIASLMRYAAGRRLFEKAIVEGNMEEGILMTGQTVGRIKDIPTVAEVMEGTVREAADILAGLNKTAVS